VKLFSPELGYGRDQLTDSAPDRQCPAGEGYRMNIIACMADRIRYVALNILGEIAGFTGGTVHDIGYWAEDTEERICRAKFACRCYQPPEEFTYVKAS
jgi:hypothetical protein